MGPIHILVSPTYALLLGVCFGSFLNVCISRFKSGENILFPPSSHCPRCKHPLRWYENIPLVSFLFLMGKCAHCRRPISIQYPVVEAVTGALFWLSAKSFSDPGQVVMSYFWASFIVLLVVSDIKWKLLPHPFNNLFIVAGIGFAIVKGMGCREDAVFTSLEGMLGSGALMVLLARFFPKGLGGGDIKTVAAFGAWLGLVKTVGVVFLAFGAGALLTAPLLLAGKVHRRTAVPFGPFLGLAAGFVWFRPVETQWFLDRIL